MKRYIIAKRKSITSNLHPSFPIVIYSLDNPDESVDAWKDVIEGARRYFEKVVNKKDSDYITLGFDPKAHNIEYEFYSFRSGEVSSFRITSLEDNERKQFEHELERLASEFHAVNMD